MPHDLASRRRLAFAELAAVCLALLPCLCPSVAAAGPGTRSFDLPSDAAENSLVRFAAQAGVEVVFATSEVGKVRTNAVKGRFPSREALDLLVAGTGLTIREDPKTGALLVTSAPKAPRAAPVETTGGRPAGTDDMVRLNPFEVRAGNDNGYSAVNSNSLTAFKIDLAHLPVSADIFDKTFMDDVGATTVEGIVQGYSAGAGLSAASPSASALNNQPGDRVYGAQTQLRGLTTPAMQRDGFLMIGTLANPGSTGISTTSNFDVERVEVINGPQSLLYKGGAAGGVINVVSKQATIGAPDFGSVEYRIDNYGSKYAQFDTGASEGRFAVRVALVKAANDTRRIDIGDELSGGYVQAAGEFGNTIVRLTLEQTTDWHVNGTYLSLTSAGDPNFGSLNGQPLGLLLATGKSGAVDNGLLDWSNLNSLEGVMAADKVVTEFGTLSFESRWTPWLSTQLSLGLSNFFDDHVGDTQNLTFYSPAASANPLPGNWTLRWSGYPASDGTRPYRSKAARLSALFTNDLFGGKAESQTIVGGDYLGTHGAVVEYGYYQADSNWNVVSSANPATAGRIAIPALAWPVNNGPVEYPLFNPIAPRITYNGANYVRAIENPVSPSLISPQNPIGTSIPGGPTYLFNVIADRGAYGMNHTQWLDGRLDTLAGVRWEDVDSQSIRPLAKPAGLPIWEVESKSANFNVGADYHLLPWVAPYATASDTHYVPPVLAGDPDGNQLPPSHSLAEEAGVKLGDPAGSMSASLGFYHTTATNQLFTALGGLVTDINPTGLNGSYDSDHSSNFTANAESRGAQFVMTASPAKNWRIRLGAAYTDGTFESTRVYPQLYNDQFYEDKSGDVTYADGTIVHVPATYNSKQLTVPAGAAGAVPLTAALISDPSSSYYANPNLVSGAINTGSPAANVLKVVDPVHGPILTGSTGLPISQIQLATSMIPGLAIPGSIPLAAKGDPTTGYPEYSANFTSVYEFGGGPFKGFKVGGTVTAGWHNRRYSYYPAGIANPGASKSLFILPAFARLDLVLGYSRRIGRIAFSTQLNIFNVFNHYAVIVYPSTTNGFNTVSGLNANLDWQPRSYSWTNTIRF